MAEDGKHRGEPSDKPWTPPAPTPSPDGSGPAKSGAGTAADQGSDA